MKIAITLGLLMAVSTAIANDIRVRESEVEYSDSVDLSLEHSSFKLANVYYYELPTKVEYSRRPGCYNRREESPDCTLTRVLEKTPVVQVDLQYTEGVFRDLGYRNARKYVTFNFPVSSFSEAEIQILKDNSGYGDFFSRKYRVRQEFLKAKFELLINKEARTVRVVDMNNSRLCPTGRNYPEPSRHCQEIIVYTTATTFVNAIKINIKK